MVFFTAVWIKSPVLCWLTSSYFHGILSYALVLSTKWRQVTGQLGNCCSGNVTLDLDDESMKRVFNLVVHLGKCICMKRTESHGHRTMHYWPAFRYFNSVVLCWVLLCCEFRSPVPTQSLFAYVCLRWPINPLSTNPSPPLPTRFKNHSAGSFFRRIQPFPFATSSITNY